MDSGDLSAREIPVAGFYPDPLGRPLARFWDGLRWGESTFPFDAPPLTEQVKAHDEEGRLDRWDLARLASFRSRTRRVEFWAAYASATAGLLTSGYLAESPATTAVLLSVVLNLLGVWLLCGAAANRAHDLGHPGWLILLILVPFVGLVFLVWLGSRQGEPGPNKWGSPVG